MTPAFELPQHPGLDSYCELAGSLDFLGCGHIIEFLLAGQKRPFMVADGVWINTTGFRWERVDYSYLETVRRRWHGDADARRRARADHIIGLLERALSEDPQALRRLSMFQLGKLLHALRGVPPKRLRAEVAGLGVADREADLLVAGVMTARGGPDPRIVEAAITARWAKELRTAGRHADQLEGVAADEVLQAFLQAVRADNHRLDAALAEAASLERAGEPEAAAACYLRAAALAGDEPEIEAGLRRCPPPPPRDLRTDIRGSVVDLRWTPARTTVGVLSYRVVRAGGASHVLVCEVAHGPDLQASDDGVPPGQKVAYEVTTVRQGLVESEPVISAPLQVTPDAEELTLACDRRGVTGHWRVPRGAAAVRVMRTDALLSQGPGPGVIIRAGRTRFRDRDVQAGRRYQYRVTCGYRVSPGQVAWSAGQTAAILAERWPQPVADVGGSPTAAGDAVALRWDSPGAGHVTVLDSPAALAPGTDLPAAAVSSLGTICWQSTAGRAGSEMHCEISLPDRRLHHLTLVTVVGDRAVAGATQAVDVLPGVHGLDTQRRGENLELTWNWPGKEVTQALVNWSYPGEPPGAGRPLRVTRDGYQRRGVQIPARDPGCTVIVTPLSTVPASISVGPPDISCADPQYELAYELRRSRRGRGPVQSVDVRISGTPPLSPSFVLIARPGTIRPTRVTQGPVLMSLDIKTLPAGDMTGHQISPRSAEPPCYLLGFVTGPGAQHVRLTHPDRSQLLVER